MSQLLANAPTLKDIFEGARREIMALIPATGMSISLLTREKDKMHWAYGYEFGNEVDLTNIPLLPLDQGLIGHVIKTGKILYLDKNDNELRQQLKSFTVGAEQETWLGLPLIVSGAPIGVLSVENDDAFNEREIELLHTIVGPLASAIHNFIQLDELQTALLAQSAQRIRLQTAAEVAAAASSVLDQDTLTQESVNLIKERFSLYYVGLFLIDVHENAVLVAGTGEAGRLQVEAGHFLPVGGQSLIGGATADATPRIIQNVTQNKEWLANPHLPQTKAELALPLRVRGRVIGALTAQSETAHLFSDELIQVLQTLCDQLATAVANAQLLKRVEDRAQRQQALAKISTELHQTSDVDEILKISLHAISKHLNGAQVKLQMGNKPTAAPESTVNGEPASNE
jgi:GAF domain-containing protein